MGVVDTIMVGRLGPAAIGAVALGNAVCYTPSMFGMGLMLGLDTLVAQAYGRKDHDECHRWLAQGVYLAFIAAVPIMAGIALASFWFARFGIAAEVAGPAGGYMRFLCGARCRCCFMARRGGIAGRGPGARDYRDICGGEPGELVRELGADLRQAGDAGAGVSGSAISTVVARVTMAAALMGFAWRYERKRGHPLFRHWAGPQTARLKQL